MTTDREMLELAAKAAGIKIDKSEFSGGGHGNTGFDVFGNAVLDWRSGTKWNPIADDGDALRLAVKLNIDTLGDGRLETGAACMSVIFPIKGGYESFSEPVKDGDEYAAMRIAITRAAAEIGRTMP